MCKRAFRLRLTLRLTMRVTLRLTLRVTLRLTRAVTNATRVATSTLAGSNTNVFKIVQNGEASGNCYVRLVCLCCGSAS